MANLRYITCCKNYRQQIIERFRPAQKIPKFFSKSEIEKIRLYQFQNAHRAKFQETASNIQSVVDMTDMFKKMPWLQYRFEELFGRGEFSTEHSGNFYITTQPHDCHVDLPTEDEHTHRWYDNMIPWKSVIIPLFLRHGTKAWTAFYKQRRIGYSVTFDRDFSSSQDNSAYRIARVYDGLVDQFGNPTDAEKDYGQWSEERYPHVSQNNLRGFEEETILEHETGSLFVFDACQIHASVLHDGKPADWMKNGINIQFYKYHDSSKEF